MDQRLIVNLPPAVIATAADVAIVFGYFQEGEFNDRPNISLDGGGDALISAVAAANRKTIGVLQTGGPVVMPWVDDVNGILEVWYAGEQMGPASLSKNREGPPRHWQPPGSAEGPVRGRVDSSPTRPRSRRSGRADPSS